MVGWDSSLLLLLHFFKRNVAKMQNAELLMMEILYYSILFSFFTCCWSSGRMMTKMKARSLRTHLHYSWNLWVMIGTKRYSIFLLFDERKVFFTLKEENVRNMHSDTCANKAWYGTTVVPVNEKVCWKR